MSTRRPIKKRVKRIRKSDCRNPFSRKKLTTKYGDPKNKVRVAYLVHKLAALLTGLMLAFSMAGKAGVENLGFSFAGELGEFRNGCLLIGEDEHSAHIERDEGDHAPGAASGPPAVAGVFLLRPCTL